MIYAINKEDLKNHEQLLALILEKINTSLLII